MSNATAAASERVDADEIAEVVSSWTGVPVGRLLQGETEKLLKMEEVIGKLEAMGLSLADEENN